MPAKVTLKVTEGALSGKVFAYTEKETLILGRQADCSVVIPENTVSRYHCMIEINPPEVTIRDFGSLNGTFLNNKKIGQRAKDMSVEDARNETYNEFPLKQGDTLGLGSDCKLAVSIEKPVLCRLCLCELADAGSRYTGLNGNVLCRACYEKQKQDFEALEAVKKEIEAAEKQREEAERLAADLAVEQKEARDKAARERAEAERIKAKRIAEELKAAEEKRKREAAAEAKAEDARRQHRCAVCGAAFVPAARGEQACPACMNDPEKMLMFLLGQAMDDNPALESIKGYKKIKLLGRGGMGEVWMVEEERSKKRMALKLMLPKSAANPHAQAVFMREAANAKLLKHKNVVRQIDSGNSNGTFFILMELCEGGSVDGLLKKQGGRLPVDMATDIILQVLDGLDYAHHARIEARLADGSTKIARGLVHRDLKPANIFLSDGSLHPTAKVADFGLAKSFEMAGMSGMTWANCKAGTAVFMPRQQILNFRFSKPEVDVWAAAASYYYMLTGMCPKKTPVGRDIWLALLNGNAVPIRERNASIPARLAEVIDTALIDNPKIEVTTAADFKKMIRGARG